ncbi:Peptidase S58 DmpA/arginine biosynthesis protein ArgJ [Metarhizium rileyi]|uniref:Peptidase S58 DmpA/arginine biosynthesis protein ArgJ n=1 Tax=Metarhizium rileyi (strain RCEF 4871) TaxID=1649241 RepID=A0A167KE75_METRR|nr:Peptidase S58 DmpA/arginine biosynthesis protein ArgJ [Metarhizium rileyi RCEF 4871]
MTGTHWINETGLLTSPIILTNSTSVGDGYRDIMEYAHHNFTDEKTGEMDLPIFAVVAGTFDGYLNDQSKLAVTPEHIVRGIDKATAGAVPEGNIGGRTAMLCHRYKGDTGSSSRTINGYDIHKNLHVDGRCKRWGCDCDDSIIIIVAIDAPLLPVQLQRVATRATVGLGKVGSYGNNSSGDILLAFSTANKIAFQEFSMQGQDGPAVDQYKPLPRAIQMSDNDSINNLFEAAANATEEAIYNSICMAETRIVFKGRTVKAIDLDKVKEIVGSRLE